MKSTFLKITLMAFIAVGAFSCKNTEKEAEAMVEDAAEPTEMATEYTVDTSASQIMWEGAKPTGKHNGTIMLSSGTIHLNEGNVEAGEFVIDMNSINDEDLEGEDKANLEAHLKGTVEGKEGDFFNVKEYPTAKFEMTGYENNMVKGNLTIKDKTHAIEFPATVTMEGDKMMLKSETFEIDRTKWGVNYGSKSVFPNLGDKFINDTMKITVSLVANKA
ncbi:YceI family protein [Aequorivita vladivostokensis]|jgi:polyisoprenoid-binding protein YceI|uniref:Lipid-binding protein n=1 Tax=Aequorivita vladivostokensis TaxID=171194 RepID=A0ABR5DHN7_9FLAO|nr:YceI family protein [Aequorivita vladivostokensis]KJJ38257.1 lipid-binding protein [Aequorivita vladivostokensis]MDX1783203.1 YceI family protein [Aequorivita vladivostokensis]|tara:strand:+ start:44455 stop:45108 length:654 start_codon:yes stop_codon:yes gene_type:complete